MTTSADIASAFSLKDRVAVIIGGASGFGLEAARLFAAEGATVALADLNADGLTAAAARLEAAGAKVLTRRLDASVREEIDSLADWVAHECGGIDIWLHTAGISCWSDIVSIPTAQAERTIAINLMGPYWGVAAAGRIMIAQGRGSIITISSTAGSSPVPMLSVYGMAKAGVEQLTRVAAKEFGPAKVRVNCISPGWCDTPINAEQYSNAQGEIDPVLKEQRFAEMAALSPLNMIGSADDIAMGALYLASDASKFVTGQVLRISGGI